MTDLQPSPQHRFTFGLPTSTYQTEGFYEVAHGPIEPWEFVQLLGEIGAWGVAIHDDELAPPTATRQERESLVSKFRTALDSSGMVVSTVTTAIPRHHVFENGAYTSADRDVRRFAVQKAMRALDLGMDVGAAIHVFGGAHEGVSTTATRTLTDALDRYREAINFLCEYARDQSYSVRFTLVPSASARHDETLLPTSGHVLAFIETLDHPEMVWLSSGPHVDSAPSHNSFSDVVHAIWSGKLAHVELNAAPIDVDCGFGSAGLKDAFFLVKTLEEAGFKGPRHFGARPHHGDDMQEMSDFATGCMRTYLALAAKARRFAVDRDIQEAMADAGALELAERTIELYSRDVAEKLAIETSDPDTLLEHGYHHERLDRLVTDLLLGLR